MRRIGSNIRKQNTDAKANRIVRNIIKYTDAEKPRNEYPKRIMSPVSASACCRDENREMVGSARSPRCAMRRARPARPPIEI